jgi:predicted MFS family arabinose efflux permease
VLCDVHGDLTPIFVLVVVIAVLSATQDIATDATAVVLLRPSERGLANGIQFAGGNVGFIIGGGGMLVIYDHLGWSAAVTALAVITAVPIPFVLRYREPELPSTVADGRRDRRVLLRMLVGFFRRPGTVPWLLFVLPLNYMGIATAYKLITPLLVDSGWPLDSIGVVAGFGGGVVAMISALAAGAVLRTVARRTALLAFGLIAIAAIAALSMVLIGATLPVVVVAAVLVNVANASVGTAIFTLAMDYSRPELAGTDYTLQTSLAVLCSDVAGAAGLSLAGHVGYATVITGSLLLAVSGLVATAALLHARPVSATSTHA